MSKRKENDFYPTPSYSIHSLLNNCDLSKVTSFLEPCIGIGSIYNKININGTKEWTELSKGKDYLNTAFDSKFDLIITNPPFSLAKEFLEKSLKEANNVFYLLRLGFLASQDRYKWWKEIGMPNKLLILSKRPKFINNRSDSQEYGWFCWDRDNIINLPDGIHCII